MTIQSVPNDWAWCSTPVRPRTTSPRPDPKFAAGTIWDSILDTSPFPNGVSDLEAALGGLDRNNDGDLCLKRIWGDDLNPNSNWYGVIANYLRDNTAAATDS